MCHIRKTIEACFRYSSSVERRPTKILVIPVAEDDEGWLENDKLPLDTISARDTKHSGMIKINSARARGIPWLHD